LNQKEFERIFNDINMASFQRRRKCFIKACPNTAIQSHLVQRKGVLNNIAQNGHLYAVEVLHFPKIHYTIKKIGWKNVFTFHGFCATHDSVIFEPIERNDIIDFGNYRSLLLLSYRPLLCEYREKEKITEAMTNVLKHEKLSQAIDIDPLKTIIAGEGILMRDVEFLLLCLQEDLYSDTEQFIFEVIDLPRVDVCIFSVISFSSLYDTFLTDQIDLSKKELIPALLFHMVPTGKDTKLILGYHRESEKHLQKKIELLGSLSTNDLLKELSDMLIRSCGSWCCSEYFFEHHIKSRKSKIMHLMNYYIRRNQFLKEKIELNLFEDIQISKQ
jgi:hypothetical protein